MKERLLAALGSVLGLALFALAAMILHRELQQYHYADVVAHFRGIAPQRIALAMGLTALGYLSLTRYDALAFRWIRHPLAYPRIALASFIAYVFSHNVGLSIFGGSAVRYRMLVTWGVKPGELARVIAFNVITFWLGFLALGGAVLLLAPISLPGAWHPFVATSRPVGALLLVALAAYVLATLRRDRRIRLGGLELELPGPGFTLAQTVLSIVDWALAAAALFVLLPETGRPGFPVVLGSFLLAQVLGVASHVPAGLGVFEMSMVVLLAPWLAGDRVLGSVLAYRVIYYLGPMAIAVVLFVGFELFQRRIAVGRVRNALAQWGPELVPRFFGASTFAAGVILLFSGAVPAIPGRMELLHRLLPLPIMEFSHLVASVAGLALLLLARALQQRIDAAYWATLALLIGGSITSLAKGLDWEEACVLGAMAAALAPCHR
jgi:phosphatidylglycerol lysyltransferase